MADAYDEPQEPTPPSEAVQAALREACWVEIESTWGMYFATEVESLVEALPHAALSVMRDGRPRFPAYQFVGGLDGAPMLAPAWVRLVDLRPRSCWSDEDVLARAAAPNTHLDGRSPAEAIRAHPDDVTQGLAHAVAEAIPSQED